MIVEGNKVHLSKEEYRNLRANMTTFEWQAYSKLRPTNPDDYKFMDGSIIGCIEGVMIYVDGVDTMGETIDRIRTLAEAK